MLFPPIFVSIVIKLKLRDLSPLTKVFPLYIWARYIWFNTTLHLHIQYNCVLCVVLLFKGHLERSPKRLVRHATEMGPFTVSQHLLNAWFYTASSLIYSSINIIPGPFFFRYAHSSSLPLHASHLLTSLSFSSWPFFTLLWRFPFSFSFSSFFSPSLLLSFRLLLPFSLFFSSSFQLLFLSYSSFQPVHVNDMLFKT